MSHYIERWECGHVASQCRCPGPKEERTRPGKCSTCAAQVSAMPERVLWWLNPEEDGTAVVVGFDPGESYPLAVKLVPESRLLAAEARLAEVEAELDAERRGASEIARLAEAEIATLRAERDALVPLARFGLAALNDNMENYGPSAELDTAASCGVFTRITHNDGGVSWDDTPATTQARAILAREAGE